MDMEIFEGRPYGRIYFDSDDNILAYACEDINDAFIFRDDYAQGDEIAYIPQIAFCKEENRYEGNEDAITKEAAESYGYTFNQLMEIVRSNIPFALNDELLEKVTRELLNHFDWGLPELYIGANKGLISLAAPKEHTCPNCGHHFKD